MEIISSVKALPEHRVTALNKRCKPPRWEQGTVSHTKIEVDGDGKASNRYRVILDRKSNYNNVLSIQVNDDEIKRIN